MDLKTKYKIFIIFAYYFNNNPVHYEKYINEILQKISDHKKYYSSKSKKIIIFICDKKQNNSKYADIFYNEINKLNLENCSIIRVTDKKYESMMHSEIKRFISGKKINKYPNEISGILVFSDKFNSFNHLEMCINKYNPHKIRIFTYIFCLKKGIVIKDSNISLKNIK